MQLRSNPSPLLITVLGSQKLPVKEIGLENVEDEKDNESANGNEPMQREELAVPKE